MKLTIFALGYSTDELTCGTVRVLEQARNRILRTSRCAAAEYLEQKGLRYETLDGLYEEADDFEVLDDKSAAYVLGRLEEGDVCLGVFDPASDTLVRRLRDHITAICPYADPVRPFTPFLTVRERRVTTASGLEAESCQGDLVITEIDSKLLAGDIKLKLSDYYGDNSPVIICDQSGVVEKITLCDLDRLREERYGHRCAVLLPENALTEKERFDVTDLVHLMARLRAPGGCPWDRQQDHKTLRPYLIEEAYETAAAIVDEDWDHTAEELGDVLLQVIFQANIGKQYGTFTLGDIASSICSKMIRRHRHIFGDADCPDAKAVTDEWDRIKAQERKDVSASDAMDAVSRGMPALMRAEKIQKRAPAAPGEMTLKKETDSVRIRAEELERAVNAGDADEIAARLGRMLFSVVNIARLCGIEAESCLAEENERFIKRFRQGQ